MSRPTELSEINKSIKELKNFWYQRNLKFKSWYEILVLIDLLASKGMETYVSNEPQTFYNMAHYLLTKGELSHDASIENESEIELNKRARLHRACEYAWSVINRDRQLAGGMSFVDELSFFMLVLGWYSVVEEFDRSSGLLKAQVWNPYDVYPQYSNGSFISCVHSYALSEAEVMQKADERGWDYKKLGAPLGVVTLDDYFYREGSLLYNMILINQKNVTGWVERTETQLLVAPIGGFPDKGSLSPTRRGTGGFDWRRLAGRGIFEVNEAVGNSFNKWKSMVNQILRDTAQPIMQEFSQSPQAIPEQLRERGTLYHYAPGDRGLERVVLSGIPVEVQQSLQEQKRELQKGGFNDAVYGMVEGQPGYALSLLASSSANQILYPYMDGKHFVIAESDRFWLSNLKKSGKVFQVKGKIIDKLEPTDIPEDVNIIVGSTVATAKDWLERGTIANMADKHLDSGTIISQIYELNDPEAIKRRKRIDAIMSHPMSIQAEMIGAWESYADYLDKLGDKRQAVRFRRMAKVAEAQLGAPAPGQAQPAEMTRVQAQREAGTPEERTRVAPEVQPPEVAGFTPTQLRRSIGRGSVRAVKGA